MPTPSPAPAARLHVALLQAFPDGRVTIRDESARHRRHAEAHDGGHLRATVVSRAFEGLPPLARHRLLHRRLPPLAELGVHSLALRLKAPGEEIPPSTPPPSTEDHP